MENEYVKSIVNGKIAEIEFHNPKANSLTSKMLIDLEQEIKVLSNNEKIIVIVISSTGNKSFCAGASFDEMIEISDFQTAIEFFIGFGKLILAIVNSPKLVIAKVIGKVVGGGVGLLSACDYVFATNNSTAKLSELQVGIAPFVISPAVERKIGKSAFAEMTIDTEWKNANWLNQKGLYNKIFNDETELETEINILLQKIENYSNEAIFQIKNIIKSDTNNWEEIMNRRAELSAKLVLSETTREFLRRFKTK